MVWFVASLLLSDLLEIYVKMFVYFHSQLKFCLMYDPSIFESSYIWESSFISQETWSKTSENIFSDDIS